MEPGNVCLPCLACKPVSGHLGGNIAGLHGVDADPLPDPLPGRNSDVNSDDGLVDDREKRARFWSMFILFVVSTFNYIDRTIISILQVPIKTDLHLTDAHMGALTGLSFALFYTTFSLPIARLADRLNRRNIIVISLFVWSGMTALSGLDGCVSRRVERDEGQAQRHSDADLVERNVGQPCFDNGFTRQFDIADGPGAERFRSGIGRRLGAEPLDRE